MLMEKKLQVLLVVFLLSGWQLLSAQNKEAEDYQIQEIPLQFINSGNLPNKAVDDGARQQARDIEPDGLNKEIMTRIADVYRMHVLSLDAQLNNDALSAENYINKSIASLQALLDEYPEVQNDPRFNELYRTVMTEHRQFYGIDKPEKKVEGEIFEIQKEIFSSENNWNVDSYEMPDNVTIKKTEVPLIQNRQVNRHLMYYTLKRPEVMETWLERTETYFPMMEEIFEEESVPRELIHLAMIESGLNPTARSWASAVGMWQFIQATGSMYGLEVNWWIDERKDPEKATRAAARHLKDLYNIWGDWHLAMANYNVSPRRLKRAIRMAGGEKDYWEAYPYLPRETRGYVPGFIAATIITTNPETFGFEEPTYKEGSYTYDVAEVEGLMALDMLADCAGISTSKLKDYNPELLRWATPPGSNYPLKLPTGTKEKFVENYKELPKNKKEQSIAMHTVKKGETLGQIARKYGTTVRGLYEVNEDLSQIIYPGQNLVVPLPQGSSKQIAVNKPTHQPRGNVSTRSKSRSRYPAPANSTKVTYTVKSGDTIGHIAEWFDTVAWKVRAWNGTGNRIYPGSTLTIYVPSSKVDFYSKINQLSFAQKQKIEEKQRKGEDVDRLAFASDGSGDLVKYRVRKNDTLIDIANSFDTSVGEIKRLNNLQSSRIYVGQVLQIRKSD